VREETIAQGDTPSSSATLMNRYDAPQNALSRRNIASERLDIPSRFADELDQAQLRLLGPAIRSAYAWSAGTLTDGSSPRSRMAARIAGSAAAVGAALGRVA
jgi:hypothetical protein